jgi:hypothetical protein
MQSGTMVRIGTALGSFVVEIRNDLGPVADPLAREIEEAVLYNLRNHQRVAGELRTVDIQRATFEYEVREL